MTDVDLLAIKDYHIMNENVLGTKSTLRAESLEPPPARELRSVLRVILPNQPTNPTAGGVAFSATPCRRSIAIAIGLYRIALDRPIGAVVWLHWIEVLHLVIRFPCFSVSGRWMARMETGDWRLD